MTRPELHLVVPGPLEQRTGGSIYDARMAEGLRARGWMVEVHELDGEFPMADARARASLADTLGRLPDGGRVVVDHLALGGSPDVMRAHGSRVDVVALVHLLLADDPGLEAVQRDRVRELEREALAACAGVIVTSPFTAARVQDLGVDPAVTRTVPPGTDLARLATGAGRGAPPQLLCVASVTPGKGQDVLVRALASLADVPWSCVCAGSLTRSPAYAEAVQASVRDVGLSARIAFPGECDADTIDGLYAASSVFVLPSRYEAYGMALTEAMARGLPIVTTDAGAIPHTVPAGTGILAPPGDEEALARALRFLLVDARDEPGSARTRRAEIGAAARRHASGLPTWDQAADAFAGAVAELMTAGRPKATA